MTTVIDVVQEISVGSLRKGDFLNYTPKTLTTPQYLAPGTRFVLFTCAQCTHSSVTKCFRQKKYRAVQGVVCKPCLRQHVTICQRN